MIETSVPWLSSSKTFIQNVQVLTFLWIKSSSSLVRNDFAPVNAKTLVHPSVGRSVGRSVRPSFNPFRVVKCFHAFVEHEKQFLDASLCIHLVGRNL